MGVGQEARNLWTANLCPDGQSIISAVFRASVPWQLGCALSVLSVLAFCAPGIGVFWHRLEGGRVTSHCSLSVKTSGLFHGEGVGYWLWTCELRVRGGRPAVDLGSRGGVSVTFISCALANGQSVQSQSFLILYLTYIKTKHLIPNLMPMIVITTMA